MLTHLSDDQCVLFASEGELGMNAEGRECEIGTALGRRGPRRYPPMLQQTSKNAQVAPTF
jgi:hypothetical protein